MMGGMRPIALACLVVALGLLGRPAAAAAETTPVSSIAGLMVLEPGDKNHRLLHGAVWLAVDKAATNYRWGGAHCGGKELSPSSVQLLFAAFRSDYAISLEYTRSSFKGTEYRCVTGFTITKS